MVTPPRMWFDRCVVVTNQCFVVGKNSFSASVFPCVGSMEYIGAYCMQMLLSVDELKYMVNSLIISHYYRLLDNSHLKYS